MRNLREDFVLDFSSHTFCNHGSYGSPPKPVLTKREHLLRQTEYLLNRQSEFKFFDVINPSQNDSHKKGRRIEWRVLGSDKIS